MTNPSKFSLLLLGGILLVACAGCSGSSASDEAEIKKLPSNPSATANPPAGGGSVGSSPAEFVGQQTRPDGK